MEGIKNMGKEEIEPSVPSPWLFRYFNILIIVGIVYLFVYFCDRGEGNGKKWAVSNKRQSIAMILSGLILFISTVWQMGMRVDKLMCAFAIVILTVSTLNMVYVGIKAANEHSVEGKKQLKLCLIYAFANIGIISFFVSK